MAELTHFYVEDNTKTSHSGADVYQNGVQIDGGDLTADNKYLIVARCLGFNTSPTTLGNIRVSTADDTSIATKSEQSVEYQQTGSDDGLSYLFVHSFMTDSLPSNVTLQWVPNSGGGPHQIDQQSLFLLDLDAIMPLDSVENADASDELVDLGDDWSNDANAFDGSESTVASVRDINAASLLSGEGTAYPVTGDEVVRVDVRTRYNADGGGLGWSSRFTLITPTGGWTRQKVNDLRVEHNFNGVASWYQFRIETNTGQDLFDEVLQTGITTSFDVAKVEFDVYTGTLILEDSQPVSGDDFSKTPDTTVVASLSGVDLGTNEHLILGYGRCDIANTGRYFDISLHTALDTSTAANRAAHRAEGEDGAEQRIVGFAVRHKASSGTPDVTMYGASENAGGGQNADGGGYLISLPTSLFADFEYDYTAVGTSILTEVTVASVGPYTPSVNGNHLVFGRFNKSDINNGSLDSAWIEEDTTEIRTGDSTPTHNQQWDDAKDNEESVTFQRYSISSQVTLNLQGLSSGVASAEHRWLIVVNLSEFGSPTGFVVTPYLRRPPRHVRM